MKSSLKTWLKGRNPYVPARLKGSEWLNRATDNPEENATEASFVLQKCEFNIDVLDDGTAITYAPF